MSQYSLYDLVAAARIGNDGQVLYFDTSNTVLAYSYLSMLYIRPSWPLLYDRIIRNLVSGKIRILLTGSPGIGKSQFKLYCMWRAVQSGVKSFLHQDEGEIKIHSQSSVEPADDLGVWRNIHYGIPFYVDIVGASEPLPSMVDSSAYTIIFSSPDPRRHKVFLKGRGSITYVSEPWSKIEIDKSWELITHFHTVSKEVVDSQFKLYGGVPRYVFDKADEGDEAMSKAILAKGRGACVALITLSLGAGLDSHMSHTVVHMYVRKSGDKCSDQVCFLPASPTVTRVLTELYRNKLIEKFWLWTKNKDSIFKTTAGLVFETLYSLYMVSPSGHNITSLTGVVEYGEKRCEDREASARMIAINRVDTLPDDWATDPTWVPERDVLYKQRILNMQSADAIVMSSDGELYIIQVTVASVHPIKGQGLKRIVNIIQSKVLSTSFTSNLLFVVPHMSELIKRQPLHNKHRNNYVSYAAIPQCIRAMAISQWRLVLSGPSDV